MNVSLTDELEEYVATQVQSGHYRPASEVIREALRNQVRQSMAQKLDQRILVGRQQIAEGAVIPADSDYYESKRERIRQQYMNNDT